MWRVVEEKKWMHDGGGDGQINLLGQGRVRGEKPPISAARTIARPRRTSARTHGSQARGLDEPPHKPMARKSEVSTNLRTSHRTNLDHEPSHEHQPRTNHSTAQARDLDEPKLPSLGSSRSWARDPRARFASQCKPAVGLVSPRWLRGLALEPKPAPRSHGMWALFIFFDEEDEQ
ncbi:hypothetical protein CRG98_013537 [Punica granatum]|uniref:Uncharacterized protein n=1 Tax=Punica granatum TaxID=22663 RepID=A0A2I0KC03_PUNGR|nr:hypothetical protein CRG98_013537 [Punica granatum]